MTHIEEKSIDNVTKWIGRSFTDSDFGIQPRHLEGAGQLNNHIATPSRDNVEDDDEYFR